MKIRDIFCGIRTIRVPRSGCPVEQTIAGEIEPYLGGRARVEAGDGPPRSWQSRTLFIAVADGRWEKWLIRSGAKIPRGKDWVYFYAAREGSVFLLSSKPSFLYAAFAYVMENFLDLGADKMKPWVRTMSFSIEKSTFDLILTQYARTLRGFDRESYIRNYARLGFTHIEVNALAGPFPYEQGVPGEFYPDFYTYCPALDQFVESRLNQGLYPQEYLRANLERLKENARLAAKYGLVPGLLCFEPRSVPETLFQRYPTLRGARVDHPFRSFKPRYTLSLVHPAAQKHYAEMMTKLMTEAPALEFLSVWSNDSGSGFEHTKSLYVGRNGGAYMIREWKNDDEIAKAAAANIANFYRILRDAGAKINPDFRVITRLESFYGERRFLWPELRDGIDVEVNSLLTAGWENNYPHPVYPDIPVLGSAYHNALRPEEKKAAAELWGRGSRSYFYHFFNSHGNQEPLFGIPFPWLTYEKLRAAANLKIPTLAHMGGLQPPCVVPYAVNQEIFREFQFDAGVDIEQTVMKIARAYAGQRFAADLVKAWRLVEKAIRNFVPLSLYSGFGTVWNRLLVRPLVPDIARIPEEERAYYEKVMVSPIHNPNKVDLGKDVLFELISKKYAGLAYRRIDARVWKPLERAVDRFKTQRAKALKRGDQKAAAVFADQYYRATALRCLFETLRNSAVWIYAVHEYQDSPQKTTRRRCRLLLDKMIAREIDNTREFIKLWKEAPLEWMHISMFGETPFIYGENFPELLARKIALMKKHRKDEPFIDPDYMFRVENDPYRQSAPGGLLSATGRF